jgi:hypothetical protein
MPLYIGVAHRHFERSYWESYCRIADKTKVALRRVLHRVLRLDLTASTPRTAECMNLWPSASRGLVTLRLYNFLSQVVRHAPLALRSCPVHPARLLRSDSRRVRQTGYNIMSTWHEW